jgi:hypothetical protein
MNSNRIMQQFHAIFGIFMVFFYLGTAIFLLFYADRWFTIDPAMEMIISIAFILFGINRAYQSYKDIKRLFFSKEIDDDTY